MKITLYKKAGWPWSAPVMGFLNELSVPFEIRNVTTHPQYTTEVEKKSGKCISPTLDFDGEILADASVEDVARVTGLDKRGVGSSLYYLAAAGKLKQTGAGRYKALRAARAA